MVSDLQSAIEARKTVSVSPFGTEYRMGFGYDCTSDDYKILQSETVNSVRSDGHPKQVLHVMEIWIMKEYGVKQTWSKLVSIEFDDIIADIVRRQVYSSNPFMPLLLAYSEDGQEILVDLWQNSEDGMVFVQCDMRSGGFKRLKIQLCDLAADFRDGYVVMPWVGSFVSPSM
uniref:F-box associated domain-containing protein n=1 Tax=Chenopodium quinoa TaxID=63459 RepID=A0A803MZQ7_CHEQI